MADGDQQQVTLGEVYRAVLDLRQELRNMVSRQEFTVVVQNLEERQIAQQKDLAERAEAAGKEHVRLDAARDTAAAAMHQEVVDLRKEVRDQKRAQDEAEEKRKAAARSTYTSIGLAVFAVLLGVLRDFFIPGAGG
ncbi:hypothetical protein [Curtobacterium sp. USHLN213]|uniref:hypothetical protein n=1 Tax=Curtobacterium sp. USHLN213 TaxID=3081255 RepID=UPI0030160F49